MPRPASPGEPIRPGAFRAEPEAVYAFVETFFDALVSGGVQHVCISPGSRSTPLAITAARSPALETWIGLDERASGFFALGLAKFSRRPVALVCTSGTAAANYLPAIVEAHYSRVPLLVLTADRPPELRDWGAGQTIEQQGLYGRYPRWAAEVPLATAGDDAIQFAAQLGARAANEAKGATPGPVHLNWPFREPLAPPSSPPRRSRTETDQPAIPRRPPQFAAARAVADEDEVELLAASAEQFARGVICCGPMDPAPEFRRALVAFAEAAEWPILAGPASQLRDGRDGCPVLAMGDAILRAPEFASAQRPDFMLRVGETPVSKVQRLWLEASRPAEVWWLDEGQHWGDPSHSVTRVIRRGGADLLHRAAERIAARREGAPRESAGNTRRGDDLSSGRDAHWRPRFERAERTARETFEATLAREETFCALTVARCVARAAEATQEAVLFASNSMSIRLLDLALRGAEAGPRVLCSRGASGIDGISSTALGIAATNPGKTILLTGDLAFLHDLSGLLVTRSTTIDLVIVVIDDNGGGIFSFLPVAALGEAVDFERLFGTPHGLDLERVAALFEVGYARATTQPEVEEAIARGLASGGVQIVHVPLDRVENEARFRATLESIAKRIAADETA